MQEESGLEQATFAAGCFWGVEAAFRRVESVVRTWTGYTGGTVQDPTYKQVCSGSTGHAEAVRVEFDPRVVTYDQLLEVFWTSTTRPRKTARDLISGRITALPSFTIAMIRRRRHLYRGTGPGIPAAERPEGRDRDPPCGPVLEGGGLPPAVLREMRVRICRRAKILGLGSCRNGSEVLLSGYQGDASRFMGLTFAPSSWPPANANRSLMVGGSSSSPIF